MRILVAEDDRRLAGLLAQTLVEAGWDVEVVHDGTAACSRALPDGLPHGGAYDVLLLDWMLPGMDGITVCRRLREPRAVHARADAHRPGRRPRPHRRSRRRRGRLPAEAVRPRRAPRPPAGAGAALDVRRGDRGAGRRPRGGPGGPSGLPGGAADRAVGPRVRRAPPAGLPGRAGGVALHHPGRDLGRGDRPAQQRDRRPPRLDPGQDRPSVRDQHDHHGARGGLPGRRPEPPR